MTIINISIFVFLFGLGLFSYNIYERSKKLNLEMKNQNVELLPNNSDKINLELLESNSELLSFKESLESELSVNKLEIEKISSEKEQLEENIMTLSSLKQDLESDLFELKLEISKGNLNLLDIQNSNMDQKNKSLLLKENIDLSYQIQKKDDLIFKLEKQIKNKKNSNNENQEIINKNKKEEIDILKKKNAEYQYNNKSYKEIIKRQKKQILELKSANLVFEKKLQEISEENTIQSKSDSIIATFTGNLIYETNEKRIILISSDGTKYTILQDDFPGDLVAKCGLPVTTNSKDRCIATILAELIVDGDQLILKGKEIKEIIKNK